MFWAYEKQDEGVANLKYASTSAVRMVMQEEGGEPQRFTQPVHHIHFQLCTSRAGGLYKNITDNIISQDGMTLLL